MPVPFPNDGESWIPAKKMLKNKKWLVSTFYHGSQKIKKYARLRKYLTKVNPVTLAASTHHLWLVVYLPL